CTQEYMEGKYGKINQCKRCLELQLEEPKGEYKFGV
ncbi:hypothetical protein LCGC14_1511510, partial [marine sediment metagenome]